jgi:hypothetical protein
MGGEPGFIKIAGEPESGVHITRLTPYSPQVLRRTRIQFS